METITASTRNGEAHMDVSSLNAQDRCDRCGAQAYVRTVHEYDDTMTYLLWCAHHFGEHESVLGPLTVTNNIAALRSGHQAPAPA